MKVLKPLAFVFPIASLNRKFAFSIFAHVE